MSIQDYDIGIDILEFQKEMRKKYGIVAKVSYETNSPIGLDKYMFILRTVIVGYLGIEWEEMCKSRKREYVDLRRIFVILVRLRHPSVTLNTLAANIGKSDHSTIVGLIKKHQALKATNNEEYMNLYATIKNTVDNEIANNQN